MCGVCVEIQNPSVAPSLYAAGFAGVVTGGKLFWHQVRNGLTPAARRPPLRSAELASLDATDRLGTTPGPTTATLSGPVLRRRV